AHEGTAARDHLREGLLGLRVRSLPGRQAPDPDLEPGLEALELAALARLAAGRGLPVRLEVGGLAEAPPLSDGEHDPPALAPPGARGTGRLAEDHPASAPAGAAPAVQLHAHLGGSRRLRAHESSPTSWPCPGRHDSTRV